MIQLLLRDHPLVGASPHAHLSRVTPPPSLAQCLGLPLARHLTPRLLLPRPRRWPTPALRKLRMTPSSSWPSMSNRPTHTTKERAAAASPPEGSSSSTPEPSLQSVHNAMLLHEAAAVRNLHGWCWCEAFLLTVGKFSLEGHVLTDSHTPDHPDWPRMNCVVRSWILSTISISPTTSSRPSWSMVPLLVPPGSPLKLSSLATRRLGPFTSTPSSATLFKETSPSPSTASTSRPWPMLSLTWGSSSQTVLSSSTSFVASTTSTPLSGCISDVAAPSPPSWRSAPTCSWRSSPTPTPAMAFVTSSRTGPPLPPSPAPGAPRQ